MPLVIDVTFICLAALFAATLALASKRKFNDAPQATLAAILIGACCLIGMLAQYRVVY